MIVQPKHGRKLGLIGVALTMQRENKFGMGAADRTCNEIEQLMINSNYLENAPFSWVTISVRYGLKNDKKPSYQKISKKYGDLPLTIEIDVHETIDASFEEMKNIEKRAILISLIHAGKKYELPVERLEDALAIL